MQSYFKNFRKIFHFYGPLSNCPNFHEYLKYFTINSSVAWEIPEQADEENYIFSKMLIKLFFCFYVSSAFAAVSTITFNLKNINAIIEFYTC